MSKIFTILLLFLSTSVISQKTNSNYYYNSNPQSIKSAQEQFKKSNDVSKKSSKIFLSTGLALTGTTILLNKTNKISKSTSDIMISTGIILSVSGILTLINN